jgi:serine/threonine protein kinase/Leucine-rich repeat (LRR) protein
MSDESLPAETKDPRVDAALRDYLERIDRGEPVDREDFLQRHAEIADALRSLIDAEAELRKLAGGAGPRESAGVSTRSIAASGQETVPPKLQPDRPPGTSGSGLAGRFGRYEIIRALGRGAMGAVYLALDTQLKRNVAIKTPHFEDDPSGELLKRFYREAEAAATLRHANICPVHDVGQIDGKHFISMAYIEGRPLSDLIKSGKAQNERQIMTAIRKLALALQEAHDHGIVHRDLKPANIMVDKKGEPIIMDFGLARRRRAEGEVNLTHSGDLVGSPAYMSPEQIEGDPDNVGPASDQYSLGVVLYEMLTGQLPFRGSVINVLAQILTKDMTPPSELRPGLDPRIEAVCLRMMAKKAADRFPSMNAVANELAAIVKNPAAASSTAEKSPTASRPPAPSPGDARPSQIRKSAKQKVLTESDMTSLEALVRKCLRRRDYDQVIQIVERIPEERRNAELQTLLEMARGKVDEIAFLVCEIDEAERLEDAQAALEKAEELLAIKPGHHRALEIHEKFSGYGGGGAARIRRLHQFTGPRNDRGWIPWTVLAFGLAVFAVMTGVVVIYLGKTAIVIDVKDPDVVVTVKGTRIEITGPKEEKVYVEPGEQQLKITYAGLETLTRSFEMKKGQKRVVTVSIADKKIVAQLDNAPMDLVGPPRKDNTGKGIGGEPAPHVGVEDRTNTAATTSGVVVARPRPKSAADVRAPSGSNDPNRRAAEAVLDLGGRVTIFLRGQEKGIESRSDLPRDDFRLLRVRLDDKINVTNANLKPLRGATNLVELSLIRCPITDAGLQHLDGLRTLEILDLGGVKAVTDAGVGQLRGLTKLRVLCLGDTHVTDVSLGYLAGLTDLRCLRLEGTQVTDPGLEQLKGLAHLETLTLNGTRITDAGLAHLKDHRTLVCLTLWGCSEVGDAGLANLRDLVGLQVLHLVGTRVTDRGLASLEQLTELNDLILNGTKITDAGLSHVRNLKKLGRFAVNDTRVTDAGLVHLKGLAQLGGLGLEGTRVSNAGLAELKELRELNWLSLGRTRVGDAGLRHLQTLVNLHGLGLNGTRVTDAGLVYLSPLADLKSLDLSGTRVTDAGLHRLERMLALGDLGLDQTRVTAVGVDKLRKSLPACRIRFGH